MSKTAWALGYQSPPTNAEDKVEWSYTSTPPIRLHCVSSYLWANQTKSDRVNFMNAILVDLSTTGTDFKGHGIAQLDETLCYKAEGRGVPLPDGVYYIFY